MGRLGSCRASGHARPPTKGRGDFDITPARETVRRRQRRGRDIHSDSPFVGLLPVPSAAAHQPFGASALLPGCLCEIAIEPGKDISAERLSAGSCLSLNKVLFRSSWGSCGAIMPDWALCPMKSHQIRRQVFRVILDKTRLGSDALLGEYRLADRGRGICESYAGDWCIGASKVPAKAAEGPLMPKRPNRPSDPDLIRHPDGLRKLPVSSVRA